MPVTRFVDDGPFLIHAALFRMQYSSSTLQGVIVLPLALISLVICFSELRDSVVNNVTWL